MNEREDSSDNSSDEEFDINNSDNESSSDDEEDEFGGLEDNDLDVGDYTWCEIQQNFVPFKQFPTYREPETSINEHDSRSDIFFKVFPKSLFMWTSDCTNQR